MDWHHPAYRFREESGLAWSDYLDFLHGQVRELCTNYGEIAGIWFDGDWPHHEINETNAYFVAGGSFEYDKLYDMMTPSSPMRTYTTIAMRNPSPARTCKALSRICPARTAQASIRPLSMTCRLKCA